MSKLWSGSSKLDPAVEAYTVGNDYLMDQNLLPYDIKASKAHAKMLHKIGSLDAAEYKTLSEALDEIQKLYEGGKFVIKPGQEDGHTAIEQYITERYGAIGKKIHTGRSRNDQVMAMIRLYMKDVLSEIESSLGLLSKTYTQAASKIEGIPMPGYTHMQKAMPSTAAAWLAGYGAAFEDLVPLTKAVRGLIDQNPLGTAAGFGTGKLKLDRQFTTDELDFAKTQDSPIYAGLSRGYFELALLQLCGLIMTVSSRFASDMLLFTTQEFDYFSLPPEFTTGSSIMPNKRNYDVFEIMRGNGKVVAAETFQVQSIVTGLPSGFQRDLQLTKEPFIKGVETTKDSLAILANLVPEIQINETKLKAAMSEDLYATEKVYELVAAGMPFRDAYKKVKQELFGEEA